MSMTGAEGGPPRQLLDERVVSSLAEWQGVVSSMMLPLHMVPTHGTGQFNGRIRSRYLNGIGMMIVEADPHSLNRVDKGEVRGEHHFNINLQLYGHTTIEQHGRRAELDGNDVVVFETSATYTRGFATRYGSFVLMLPQSRLGLPADAIRAITAVKIDGSQGFGSVLSTFLRGIADNFADFDERAGARIAQASIDLVAATLVQILKVEISAGAMRQGRLRASVREYIELHHADPSCTPQSIADAYFVSLRHLHTVFQEENTTVAELLRSRRLEAARTALADPTRDWMTVADVAASSGFSSSAAFARTFRAEMGCSPGHFRRSR